MRHLAHVLYQKTGKSGKKARQMPTLAALSPATTPCENELFAAEGRNTEREGSHNVKKRTENFTY